MTPLLFIRPTDGWVATPHELRQIIVPLDGSPLAEAALPVAELLATRFAVPIVVLQVVDTAFLYYTDVGLNYMGGLNYGTIIDSLQEAAEGYVHQVAAGLLGKGYDVQTMVPIGSPATAIAAYGHEHPDTLVVLTTHGRTGLAGLIVGSVARRVMQQAVVPVLLMHS
ncbi:MAG: universal stress protein [Chloroflexi bacterium]|nr:universal stress protein [Chloroflexota bacterium]